MSFLSLEECSILIYPLDEVSLGIYRRLLLNKAEKTVDIQVGKEVQEFCPRGVVRNWMQTISFRQRGKSETTLGLVLTAFRGAVVKHNKKKQTQTSAPRRMKVTKPVSYKIPESLTGHRSPKLIWGRLEKWKSGENT